MPEPKLRRTARVLLLDDAFRLLLIRFAVGPRDGPSVFWATPGGQVEEGEADMDAARRELEEELGLSIPLEGPVHRSTGEFEHGGVLVSNTDVFFLGRCMSAVLSLKGLTTAERTAMTEIRWWTACELDQTDETVFPPDLPALLGSLASRDADDGLPDLKPTL